MATLTMSEELGGLAPLPEAAVDLRSRLLAYERGLISEALAQTGGNQRRAARRLGILPTTLHEKMKRLGLRAEAFLPQRARGTEVAGAAAQASADRRAGA